MFFRNDDEFDEVKKYKQSQKGHQEYDDLTNDHGRFADRDDFIRQDKSKRTEFENKEAKSSNKATTPNNGRTTKPPKKRKNFSGVIFLSIIITLVFGVIRACDNRQNEIKNKSEFNQVSNYENYLGPVNENGINAKEFVALYQEAKNNRIKYDRIKRIYLSGNFSKPYVVNSNYLVSENDSEGFKYLCLEKNEYSDKVIIYSCGTNAVEIGLQENNEADIGLENPTDFGKAVHKYNEKATDVINFDYYDTYYSESNDLYHINGAFYTQELCDFIVKWEKTKVLP